MAAVSDERAVAAAALDAANEQLQAICQAHAGTFVAVDRRAVEMQANLKELLQQLETLQASVETSQQVLSKEEEVSELTEKHRVRRRTLLQHSSLLELLELPNVMDACVRSALYEEALQVAAFANTLSRRHGSNDTVVQQVIEAIRSRQADLRRHLLSRLRVSVTMPECLEVVTAIRRLNSIDLETKKSLERTHEAMEYQLCVDFLEARDVWLDSRSGRSSLVQDEPLLDAIERYRTRVFEVATQFNAIFRAQASSKSESAQQLLALWMTRRVQSFLKLLKTELAEDAASIRDALEASIFFASSMGRLGADFTALLPRVFERILIKTVTSFWTESVVQFKETLSVCREAGVVEPLRSDAGSEEETEEVPLADPQPAPRALLALPPLARFVNAVLNGLNELRRCLLPTIFPALRRALELELETIRSELLNHERAVHVPGFRGEAATLRQNATSVRVAFSELVEPYCRGSLEAAFGNVAGAVAHHQILRDNLHKTAAVEEDDEEEEAEEGQEDQKDDEQGADEEETGDQEEEIEDQKEGEADENEDDEQEPMLEAVPVHPAQEEE